MIEVIKQAAPEMLEAREVVMYLQMAQNRDCESAAGSRMGRGRAEDGPEML